MAAGLSFSSIGVLDVYQQLLRDPDPEFRNFAFTQLVVPAPLYKILVLRLPQDAHLHLWIQATLCRPLLTDKSASSRIQAIGIQMTIDVRQSMAYRRKATKADAYDQLVRTIAEGRGMSTSDELILVAKKYIDCVRPRF